MLHYFCRVCHGRNQLGRHEGADLDLLQSRGRQRGDPGFLRRGRHHVLGVLQPVARADFANVNLGHGWIPQAPVTGSFSSTIFFDHSAGPVLCTEIPFESTATVTGMSCTSNSLIASMPKSPKASTPALRIALATKATAPPAPMRYA